MELILPKRPKTGNPVVWWNEYTAEYRIPMHADDPMPTRYQIAGFVRKEFTSYYEHQAWCAKVGLRSHTAEDVRNDGDLLGKNRWGY